MIGNQEESTELTDQCRQYAEDIRGFYAAISANEAMTVKMGTLTLQLAISVGNLLLDLKENILPHGEFTQWVETHTGDSIKTAQRYMKVAKASQLSLLDDCKSLKDAYRVTGIIKPHTPVVINLEEVDSQEKSDEQTSVIDKPRPNEGKANNYQAELDKRRQEMTETIREMIENNNTLTWNLSFLRISRNGNLVMGADGSGELLLQKLAEHLTHRTYKMLTQKDEIYNKSLVMVSEIIRLIVVHNGTAEPIGNIEPLPLTDKNETSIAA